MIYYPEKYREKKLDINKEIAAIHGEMDEQTARITLAKFLYHNLGFTTDLIAGIKLYPDQIINIKGLMNSNFSMCVWGRGCGKSYMAAVFCLLQCIFHPGSMILIAGPTFRTARLIFNYIEKICASPDAQLLMQCMGARSKRNDQFSWLINGGEITAIPLNGEKIRGFRANILIIDEFLLMSRDMVEKVLIPYLVAPQDIKERQIIREKENELIRRGVLKEEERMKFENNTKFIALSSASYTCEYLYEKYQEFVKMVYDDDLPETGAKYYVSQMSYDSVPEDRMEKSIIESAQSDQSSSANFKREYMAQFIDGSDSYFSMKKMMDCTIPDEESPTLLLKGEKGKKYILSIDPNWSNSTTSDNFSMTVIEADEEKFAEGKVSGMVVHNYAKFGKDLKDNIKYFYYLWTNFDIHLICIDYAGYQFIESCNEFELFKKAGIEFKIFDFHAEKDGVELEKELKQARRDYNRSIHRIVFTQYFTSDFIRKGNEYLQGCIDYKKIWFGGSIKADPTAFDKAISADIDLSLTGVEDIDGKATDSERKSGGLIQMIDDQEFLLKQQKYQCASIEVKTTAKGTQSFDLPQVMKRNNTSTRMRKDSYTTLMLGCWALKQFFDILNSPQEDNTFEPTLL